MALICRRVHVRRQDEGARLMHKIAPSSGRHPGYLPYAWRARNDGRFGVAKGSWSELFRDGRGLYSALIIGGIAMNATQMLVIAIIMPTIVRDIGGASFYTWAAMLYTIGSIVGGASTGDGVVAPWCAARLYARRRSIRARHAVLRAGADIGSLIAARGVQGWAGGLVSGGGMALITSLYDARLRTRILAISQGTFTACHLSGPIVGGMFAAMHWWRGSFWLMAPLMLVFAGLAYWKIPDRLSRRGRAQPLRRRAVSPVRNLGRRRAVRRRERIGAGVRAAGPVDCRSGGACRPDLPARPAGRQQPLSARRSVVQRADRAGAVDSVAARDDADLGDPVPAAAAAGRASGVAGCDQLPQHRHFVGLDHRHLHRFGVVGEA